MLSVFSNTGYQPSGPADISGLNVIAKGSTNASTNNLLSIRNYFVFLE